MDELNNGRPRISAVVPCFNEEQSLTELYRRLTVACTEVVSDNYEIVLVNDGSQDATWSHILELSCEDSHVVGINLSRNYGHQLALTSGLTVCKGEYILIIDADLQDPPELLGRMMEQLDAGADVVYGQRTLREGETVFKKVSARLFYRMMRKLTDDSFPVDTGDFRLMSRRALDVLLSMPERHRFIRGMVSWIGFKQVPINYERAERFAGKTNYTVKKMVAFALDAITSFSILPLRLASLLGILFGASSVIVMVYTVYSWLFDDTVRGWTSLMVVVLMLGSVQMLLLGIFGEYLGRVYLESKRRPLFVIKDIACSNPISDFGNLGSEEKKTHTA